MKLPVPLTVFLLLLSTCGISAFVATPISRRPALVALNVASTTTIPFNMTHSTPTATSEILEFPEESLHYDTYSGVILHVRHLNDALSPVAYARILESSLELWKMEQRRGIWIHIPKSHGHFIPVRQCCLNDVMYAGHVVSCFFYRIPLLVAFSFCWL